MHRDTMQFQNKSKHQELGKDRKEETNKDQEIQNKKARRQRVNR
jgi:hypothetical protein